MHYKHLYYDERYYIDIELKKGIFQNKIAKSSERSQSSHSRELSGNKGQRVYRYKISAFSAVLDFEQYNQSLNKAN